MDNVMDKSENEQLTQHRRHRIHFYGHTHRCKSRCIWIYARIMLVFVLYINANRIVSPLYSEQK